MDVIAFSFITSFIYYTRLGPDRHLVSVYKIMQKNIKRVPIPRKYTLVK